jgi:hypothetical protein
MHYVRVSLVGWTTRVVEFVVISHGHLVFHNLNQWRINTTLLVKLLPSDIKNSAALVAQATGTGALNAKAKNAATPRKTIATR